MIQISKYSFCSVLFLVLMFVVMASGTAISAEMLQEELLIKCNEEDAPVVFNVEIAETPRQQERGLMYRSYLAQDAGMLFYFGRKEEMRVFWMKNTFIPLDILFLSKDGTIHHIHHMAKPQDEMFVSSKHPSSAILEINGGFAVKHGIEVGDQVLHSKFRNILAQ
ncbi:MAG: DUF192 domain-containing protein [Alphaproteobacteria bacterium]|nr:DUF192 domain-containing protein [Alphaproteobacteria bacterium]